VVDEPAWDDPDAAWADFEACLIRTTWDYMDRREEYLAWARETARRTRLFHPPEVVAWNTHKSYLRELEAAGTPLADSWWLERGAEPDLAAGFRERGWQRAMIKPLIGATARNTLRFGADEIAGAQRQLVAWLEHEDMMVQEYLPAVETEGELSIILIGGQISHGVRKVPVAGDYRVQDDFGATDELWQPDPRTRMLARDIEAAARRILGVDLLYARIDFLRDGSGAVVLNELEAVEPALFFRHHPPAAEMLADALVARLG
jgi:glutathione synthase/RimK-type ligase-like ATP-grasp enzyme